MIRRAIAPNPACFSGINITKIHAANGDHKNKDCFPHPPQGKDLFLPCCTFPAERGATEGSIFTQAIMIPINNAARRSPGSIPAIRSFPIDCSVSIPYTTKPILGGIRKSIVAPAATIPPGKFRGIVESSHLRRITVLQMLQSGN